MRYFVHSPSTLELMLKAVNKNSLEELFSSIPENARLKRDLILPKMMDERQLKKHLIPFSSPLNLINFIGAGATDHFVPEWVSQQLLRAEWYTSYTPYQPEASQGTLQAIFEFQTMVASSFGLEVANASMYDGATALAEALLMAIRIKNKKTVLLSSAIHPEYRETVRTYLTAANFKIVENECDGSGASSLASTRQLIEENKDDLAAIAIQSPNFFGRIEDVEQLADLAHQHDSLLVGVSTDMSSTAILPSFGYLGADIAVGEGLGLLGSLTLGGPGVGLFACSLPLLRQMPGRLVGETTDSKGERGFVLTLSTREQHIRRERATSNICTNHNLMALAFSMTLAAYGKEGFVKLAKTNLKKTLYFRRLLQEHGLEIAYLGPHYNETVIRFHSESQLLKRLDGARKHNIIAGLALGKFYRNLTNCLLVATTELHEDHDIRTLAKVLSGSHDG